MSKKKQDGPKILVIDIETAPMISFHWGLWDQNIGLEQQITDWFIFAFAAKWVGSKEVIYMDQRSIPTGQNILSNAQKLSNDKKMVKKIAALLDEADIVLGQNSKGFDTKKINTRIKFHNSRANQKQQESKYPPPINTLILCFSIRSTSQTPPISLST